MDQSAREKVAEALMAMTELEAAAIAALHRLDEARKAMREALEGGEQYVKQYHDLPRDERTALALVADAQTQAERDAALEAYCLLRNTKRLYQRRRGQEDRYRRTMLAIHVPLDYALEVNARASAEGMSVYAWLRRAIDRALT